jgi:transposase
VQHGEQVYDVSPHLTGRKRRTSVAHQKSDPTDALAIGRVVVQEGQRLPRIRPEDLSSILGVVVEHRDNLVRERTRLVNHLHAHMVHLEPAYTERLGALTDPAALAACQTYPLPPDDPVARMRVQVVQQLATLILGLTEMIEQVETDQIVPLVEQANTALLSIPGIQHLTAAKLMARVGPIAGVTSAAALAHYSGVAPVQRASAASMRHRVNGGGDRQLNAVFHSIAVVQKRCNPYAQAYLAKKQHEGKTEKEALRCVMRRLVDIVYAVWKQNVPYHPPAEEHAVA